MKKHNFKLNFSDREKLVALGFDSDMCWVEIEKFLWEKFKVYIGSTSVELGNGWFTQMNICTDRDRRSRFMDDMGWEEKKVGGNNWVRKTGFVFSKSPIDSKIRSLKKAISVLHEHKMIFISQNN
jgi:hypothetical protein